MDTRDDVRDVLAFLRGLVARPENLLAIKLRDTNQIVVVERGASDEGELVAVRLMPDRRTALGRFEGGRWRPAQPAPATRSSGVQVIGRVLSIIHPAGSYA
jgi:hypothetical protein